MSRSYKRTPIIKYERRSKHTNRQYRRKKVGYVTSSKAEYRKHALDRDWKGLWTKEQAIAYYHKMEKVFSHVDDYDIINRAYAKEFMKSYPTLEVYLQYWKKCCYYK